jgi:hypothetical protein
MSRLTLLLWLLAPALAFGADSEIKDPSIRGGVADGKLRVVIEGDLDGTAKEKEKVIFSTAVEQAIKVTRDKVVNTIDVTIDILQGVPKELPLTISGEGEIKDVKGDGLQDWSVRKTVGGGRQLILRPKNGEQPLTKLGVSILAERALKISNKAVEVLTATPPQVELFHGFVRVESVPELDVQVVAPSGLLPIETKDVPTKNVSAPDQPKGAGGLPYAKPAPGKPGMFFSPYDANKGYIDLRGFPAETEVKDPYSGKSFLVPGPAPAEAEPNEKKPDEPEARTFHFQGSGYTLPLKITAADPEARQVVLRDFQLTGTLASQKAAFVLTANAHVANPKGGSLVLLSGRVALTELAAHPDWRIVSQHGKFTLVFDKAGDFPLQFKFNAGVAQNEGWNGVDFQVAPSARQPITLQGLAADTQFQFEGAARPERVGENFTSFLPPDGSVDLSWKTAAPEVEGKLFYSAEMVSQISVGPGLMYQTSLIDGKVMQGEMGGITLLLRGAGEVTRVQGDAVVDWRVEPGANAEERRLLVHFNEQQKNQFALNVQTQTPIGAFPQTIEAMQVRPEGATRFAGYFRIVNEGAVRLEVVQARGLSQISPEQFPESDGTKAAFRQGGTQRFAYRFSGGDFGLKVQADQILPEVTVSELLAYNLGENEQSIDAEIELEIREAPLRELLVRVPKGYAVAKLSVQGLSDYFVSDAEDAAELRLVYAQPVSDRQLVQFRLERNQALGAAQWALPRIEVEKAKAVRGNIAVSAEPGFRLATERTQGLTELATAFFPRKVPGIQTAFRIGEPTWQATMHIERLPQSIQVDAMHLFSIGEGVAYGSSVLNYVVSGAPVSAFRVELSDEYFNVEFTGKDIRSWEKADGGYVVQLHTPVAGAYTLLATYERPFKAQGETLAFTGARPLDAQSEQGHTLVTSAYQFQVKPVDVSTTLLPLETGEVPPEYRLFFDAPILAAYRYTARPFNLKLALSPLAQGDSLSQVVDRASLATRISKEGQVLTDAHYFVKSRGHANFRVTLPPDTALWSAAVNGASVVPVEDGPADLIPLPQEPDPNAVLTVDLKLAARAKDPRRLTVLTPTVAAPVMLAEWKLDPDTAQRLVYREGSLSPVNGGADVSGFGQFVRIFGGGDVSWAVACSVVALGLLFLVVVIFRIADREQTRKGRNGMPWPALVSAVMLLALAGLALFSIGLMASEQTTELPRNLTFLAPVQQEGNALSVEVDNLEEKVTAFELLQFGWPALLGLGVLACTWRARQGWATILGWTLLAWAALRSPHGAVVFLILFAAFFFLEIAVPAVRKLSRRSQVPKPAVPPAGGAAAATAAVLLTLLLPGAWGQEAVTALPKDAPVAETVTQQIRVEDKFALATAKVHWQAIQGQRLPLLFEPAVLTRVDYPAAALKLVSMTAGGKRSQQLLALESGTFDITVEYQVPVSKNDAQTGFELPAQFGLVNKLTLTVANLDVDVLSLKAISIDRKTVGKDTVAELVLAPANDVWVGWQPRSRDVAQEKAVFYAELTQLYAPTVGVIEGVHLAAIRPAQGELSELAFTVPKGTTITDVIDPDGQAQGDDKPAASRVTQWRFDPDAGKLRVSLSPPQSHPFTIVVRSQIATGPLPVSQEIGLLSMENSAGQIGVLGLATGNEVQLDSVTAGALAAINLEDFPADAAPQFAAQIPGLAVRRAFRYADASSRVTLKASAVEPDVRVESQETVSLGEDRTLLAVDAAVNITRAGIFSLSFALPTGMDVESVSGASLSHWTELKTDAGRIISLHLRGRTDGQQQFSISLAGPGLKTAKGWAAPHLIFREASKQRGSYVVAPEQGMRLQVTKREGISQLDPQKSGIKQKGVLAFRVLQTPWSLAVDIEQVDSWVQVTSLQHATVGEAQVKVTTNLQFQIENAGLKTLHVLLPATAENVRFTGEQVADFLLLPGDAKDGLKTWEVKLQRRIIGQYFLQATYQTPVAEKVAEITLQGAQVADVNLQRGFVTVQTGGRLQVRVDAPPAALQPVEWQSIPRVLQKDLTASSASFAYRLVEPAFALVMKLERHEVAKLLPARVNSITFTSVISDNGAMLTQAHLAILPGDKRLLHLTLPKDAKFWFAFVNQNGVWPWREGAEILIPLEQVAHGNEAIPVEVYFSSEVAAVGGAELDLQLAAPKFDLPLENITWHVYLNDRWRLKNWNGSLQLQEDVVATHVVALDVQSYLQSEATQQRDKTKEAEKMIALGNSALAQGNPQQARRAFASAFGLSQHDNAFNEDARVQLHNVKLQEAIIGLNVRQSTAAGEPDAIAGKLRSGHNGKDGNYSQQDAKQVLDSNTADENAAFSRLAERLIQQQDAAVGNPAAIRANVPEEGRLLTFSRSVAVDPWSDLQVAVRATAVASVSWLTRLISMAGVALLVALFVRSAQSFSKK